MRATTTTFDAIPSHFECNPHVLRGYRPPGMSWRWYARSTLAWHNETVNAATMFVGLVVFLDGLERAIRRLDDSSIDGALLSLVVFRACTATMFACSTAYHAFWPRSRRVYETLLRLDHACIVLCVGSYAYPTTALVVRDGGYATSLRLAYWTAATVVTTINVATVWRGKRSNMNTTRRLRATATTAWFVPVLLAHDAIARASSSSASSAAASAAAATYRRAVFVGLLYPLGALAYATRVPDKLRPGWFDHVGSHEFMHACVLIAAVTHGKAFEEALWSPIP